MVLRDFTVLSGLEIAEWTDEELTAFHHYTVQLTELLNSQGVDLRDRVVREMTARRESR